MASKALPNPTNENSTERLLGQVLSALEKQNKMKRTQIKFFFMVKKNRPTKMKNTPNNLLRPQVVKTKVKLLMK